jgi:cellulase/cellobiase CelA1
VADAARRSTRSGRKNRASERRKDFFEHRKAVGADAPAATFGAHLCAVRIWIFRPRKI